MIPELDTPQEEVDRTLPESTPAGALPTIEDDTMRLLGEIGAGRHVVTLDRSGDICLITILPGEDGVIGPSCGSPVEVDAHGLGLRVTAADAGTEAYLVRPGLDEALRDEAAQTMQSTTPVHENLLAVTDEGSLCAEQTLDVAGTDGGTFTLRRI